MGKRFATSMEGLGSVVLLVVLFSTAALADELDSTGSFTATLQWTVEWVLIGAIAVLAFLIIRMLVFGSGTTKATPDMYKPQRKPAKIFLLPSELAKHDGADSSLPVYVAVRGTIYDVTSRRDMYGIKGQGYNCLAGRDASRALAKHSLDEKTCKNPRIDDLSPGELDALDAWEASYSQKYQVVGYVVQSEEEKAAKTAEEKKRYDLETARLREQEKQQAASKGKAK